MDKQSFRQKQLARLKFDPVNAQQQEVERILTNLFSTTEWQQAKTIATVINGPIEFPTASIIEQAQSDDKQVYLPKVMPKRQMVFLPFESQEQLIKSKFGLLEPALNKQLINQKVDLIVVPGIAFTVDRHYRVGFGGGYYDRFLETYSGTTVSLVPQSMVFATNEWPVETYDIPIQILITANGIKRSSFD
ncbi:5-formyltetrahydrofolate cyclo-ligase [Lapidilactobacillus bayanensis]|uniref:5-formyltetrahydrofolate cyclo-ligase n=1 Tax=Lapidilactobacillus bayanensis TaxID=2485998 RepID=UPI000F76C169|nr:5-formyltetrahydrofolate cyclo-ligase [Lapidilactobacillus bayanensis]